LMLHVTLIDEREPDVDVEQISQMRKSSESSAPSRARRGALHLREVFVV
jgi:hypothetical protein